MFYVAVYDIEDNRKRLAVAERLLVEGTRVQKSVFELDLDKQRLSRIVQDVRKIINLAEDGFRVYPVCKECFRTIDVLSGKKPFQPPPFYIV